MQTLFLSDLHLAENTPEINIYFKKFIDYCQHNIESIDSLYILGDFFEFWVGDDYQSEFTQDIFRQLSTIGLQTNIHGYFMHGNRDFLLGKGCDANSFEKQTGFTIIDDPYCIELDSQRTVLTHGDILCTDDKAYQKLRQMLRNTLWQQEMLSKTIEERINIALASRKQSQQNQQQPDAQEYISNVNQDAVYTMLRQYQCKIMIHGHTHRPDTHLFTLNGQQIKRIVLAAWYKQGSFLKYQNKIFSTIKL